MTTTSFLPLLNSYVEKWAKSQPEKPALIQHEDGKTVSYRQFVSLVDFFALRLLDMGICKGDRVATMLVLVPEHILLKYACFKIGAICALLDVRLKEQEVVRDLNKIEPKAFFLGNTEVRDFRLVGKAVQEGCPTVERLVQFTPNPKEGEILPGAVSITEMMDKKRMVWLKAKNLLTRWLEKTYARLTAKTTALVIYTTGTTGAPKPAVLCHENIFVQNEVLARGANMGTDLRVLINLPPSHVGCLTELLISCMYCGGTAVMLRILDPKNSLEALAQWKVNTLGMIPTQYQLVWRYPDYEKYDLSNLRYVVYGGSSVDQAFPEKLACMAPRFGTGLGMTEGGGFCTFTPPGITIVEMAGQVGCLFPDLAAVTVRKLMNPDGTSGAEMKDGETGEICCHPELVFMGYSNQPEATAQMVSTEGILYSGDLGYYKPKVGAEVGPYRALYLSGRRKFVIKQSGYLVFPDEVEAHIAGHPAVDVADVEGLPHEIFGEGIFAFVHPKVGIPISPAKVMEHCKQIASYKRPVHVEIWEAEKPFPLTRSAKVDKLEMARLAGEVVERLRGRGGWDVERPTPGT